LKESLEQMWEQEGNIVVINKGFYGITLLLNDYVNYLQAQEILSTLKTTKMIFEEITPFLDTIIHFYKDLDEEKANGLKTSYGTPGDAKYWRTLQLASRQNHPEVEYKGLDEYLKKEDKENNERAFKLIREIESIFLKDRIQGKLETEYGKHWFKKGVPEKIYADAHTAAAKKNLEIEDDAEEKQPWDQLHLINYREIILKNWQKLFEKMYSMPGSSGNKDAKTTWLVQLNRIRNENSHTYYVTSGELSFIEEIYDWLSNPI
jgi:DNA sulfur modification protein DndB